MDRRRELDLLLRQVLLRILRQELREDEERVERRAQLVTHVREELALVLRRKRELLGAVLQRRARELDLAVLDLDSAVLLCKELRLLLELLVRLLQLFLLSLQQLFRGLQRLRLLLELDVRALQLFLLRLELFGPLLQLERQALRLAEELFRPHRRLDRVDDDADRLPELLEEAALHLRERRERGELDHAHHLIFEENRHDHDAPRRRLAQSRGDLDVVLWRL